MGADRDTVLVATGPEDVTADLVILALHERGVPVARVDPAVARASFTIGTAGWSGCLRDTPLEKVRSVYWRRPTRFHLDHHSQVIADWSRREHNEGIRAVLWDLPAVWVNHPRDNAAATKPAQLACAAAFGLDVPETLITNDPDAAREFTSRFPCVTKTFAGAPQLRPGDTIAYSIQTLPVTPQEIDGSVSATAHLFQRRVQAAHDVRITVVADQVFAASADTVRLDWRVDTTSNWRAVELPARIVLAVRHLTARFGLRYAALDFAVDHDGRWWFYELNPNGQFGFIQQATGQPIAEAIADVLAGTHH